MNDSIVKARKGHELPPGSFVIDRSKPPYEVPCPECRAFALEPCRSGGVKGAVRDEETGEDRFGWPDGSRIVPEPHPARWEWWHAKPEYRVKAIVTETKELPK